MVLVRNFCRFFVGALFIFSGFVKIVDPIGTAIKLEKYFMIFSTNFTPLFESLLPYTLPIAIIVISAEIILGFALLFLFKMQFTAWKLLGLILFFTVLTLYTAITGAPKDCGCFGDFLKLTPWTSFGKDVVLSIMILVIFIERNRFESIANNMKGAVAMLVVSVATFYFAYYNLAHLPVIDFRPYEVGNYLPTLMTNGKDAVTHYKVTKNGEEMVVENITMEHMKDPYKYVGTVVVEEPVLPTIVDFNLYDSTGYNKADELMQGTRLLFVIRKLKPLKSDQELIEKMKSLEELATGKASISSHLILSIGSDTYKAENLPFKGELLTLDTDISKAVVRSDVGVLLLKDGTVKGKWHYNDVPSMDELAEKLAQ